ncbi:uncharacterized protein LOC131285486 [Anopheles ziemanni]|uniref:uncharacterized protein LOC131272339 n=1 Tax=Anopheles coustani TaxID=139045 RepID=UPI00265A9B11|nr:uncharacterized protein LOC131272339 [Anopheles coustani]XP_058170327.1 uncharacterized protein LOC131285486 [Anopheles ziemanni]
MAAISIGHLLHTERPLTWHSQHCCARCSLPFTISTSEEGVKRVPFLLDCYHQVCGQCVEEKRNRRITCEICKHRTSIPEEGYSGATPVPQPSLFMLGVLHQTMDDMANVASFWLGEEESSAKRDHVKEPLAAKLSRSEIDTPKKVFTLLEKAFHAYEKSKKHVEKRAKMQQENVCAVIEQINAHFITLHNALQIAEQRVLLELRKAYIERCQQNKDDLHQLHRTKDRVKDFLKQAKRFPDGVGSSADPAWANYRSKVKDFLESEPIAMHGDLKKNLQPPFHYKSRDFFLKSIRNCHKLDIDDWKKYARLVPTTFSSEDRKDEYLTKPSSSTSKSNQEEEGKDSDKAKKSSSQTQREEKKERDRSKERSSRKHRSSGRDDEKGRRDRNLSEGEIASSFCSLVTVKVEQETSHNTTQQTACERNQSSIDRSVLSEVPTTWKCPSLRRALEPGGGLKWRTVTVMCIVNPREFYIQDEMFSREGAASMCELCNAEAADYERVLLSEGSSLEITPGKMYLIRPEEFFNNGRSMDKHWYRAEVLSAVDEPAFTRGQYRVQYIDFGHYDTVGADQIRPMSAELAERSPMATRCALYQIQPMTDDGQWSEESRQLMTDIINNQPMVMCELNPAGERALLVDLFLPPALHAKESKEKSVPGKHWMGRYAPMSLREALIYHALAEPSREMFEVHEHVRMMKKSTQNLQHWRKEMTNRKLRQSIPDIPVLLEHDQFDCIITQAESLESFHIMPTKWKTTALEPLQKHLASICLNRDTRKVYSPYVGLVCAFARPGKDGVQEWMRGRVLNLSRGICLLHAIDTGEQLEVEWNNMRLLPTESPAFSKHPLAVPCRLGYIWPKENTAGWTADAIDEFRQFACGDKFRFAVSIGRPEPHERIYNVVLFLVNKSDRDTCINGLLVRNGHADCSGFEKNIQDRVRELSTVELEQQLTEQKEKESKSASVKVSDPRVPVTLLKVISPGEFYVLISSQQTCLEQLHQVIQEHMDDHIDVEEENEDLEDGELSGNTTSSRSPGDVCVVFARVNAEGTCEWHRARIESVLPDGYHYEVFLIDRASKATVHRANVARLTPRMAQVQAGAVRCRLACLEPVGGSTVWHQSTLDVFERITASYSQHAISLDTKPTADGSDSALSVLLWGVHVESRDALAPCRTVYTNLNQVLVHKGLAHLAGRFRKFATSGAGATEEHQLLEDAIEAQLRAEYVQLEQFFRTVAAVKSAEAGGGRAGTVHDGSKAAQTVLNEGGGEAMNDGWLNAQHFSDESHVHVSAEEQESEVDAWLAAEPLEKTVFVGVPSAVGANGVVYLHDVCQEPVLEQIRSVIETLVAAKESAPPERSTRKYAFGNPCLARFHLDGCFYRATIQQVLAKDRYEVLFVDYGNVEECAQDELLPATVCGNVPIQAIQVHLSGVKPKGMHSTSKKGTKKESLDPSGKWPDLALDTLHPLIVQKRCSIRIDVGEKEARSQKTGLTIPYCKMRLIDSGGCDVAQALLDLGMFEQAPVSPLRSYTPKPPAVVVKPMIQPEQLELTQTTISTGTSRSVTTVEPSVMTAEQRDLLRWMEQIDSQYKASEQDECIEDPNDWKDDEDSRSPLNRAQLIDALDAPEIEPDWNDEPSGYNSDRSQHSFRVNTHDDNSIPSPATLHSEDIETSTRCSGDGIGGYAMTASVQLSPECRAANPILRSFPVLPTVGRTAGGFFAEYTNYGEELTVYVYPHLEGHTRRMAMVSTKVQERARSINELHRWQASLLEPGAPCLAPFSEDGLYYRALLETVDEQRREATVLFVDYLNRETVSIGDLRKCPIELQRAPLRNIPVQLVGVRSNPRLREIDIAQRLIASLERAFYVKLLGPHNPDNGVLPVEFYTTAECSTLVYQQLLDERYLLRVDPEESF